MTRRDFLKRGGVAVAACAFPNIILADSAVSRREKRIELYNIHTGEHARALYWADGEYIEEEMAALEQLLRDYRTGEIHSIDRRLYDLLHDLQARIGVHRPYHVISGYRSPLTNAMLRRHSHGVAKHSLHMEGRAIDINLPGVHLRHLRHLAMKMRRGGVGYYPKSGFVHVDTGRVRYW
ncbi:YcbK family protein [Hydrogenimonas sp. SS33]|uniref:YcbK family protein n=1 Tax=Hydrogenimonas leucolamina TaxID=2954236 RepID=UPI00336BCA3C